MSQDLLVQIPAKESGGTYEAFKAKDNQRRGRLNLRCKGGMSHAPGYHYIIDICYDEDNHTGILLVLSTMLVMTRGRNLKPIVDALMFGTCDISRNSVATALTSRTTPQRRSSRPSTL